MIKYCAILWIMYSMMFVGILPAYATLLVKSPTDKQSSAILPPSVLKPSSAQPDIAQDIPSWKHNLLRDVATTYWYKEHRERRYSQSGNYLLGQSYIARSWDSRIVTQNIQAQHSVDDDSADEQTQTGKDIPVPSPLFFFFLPAFYLIYRSVIR